MSRFDIADAMPVADEMVRLLTPWCERIEIAGSIRRAKLTVGDIEILYIPKFEQRQAGLFDVEPFNLTEELFTRLVYPPVDQCVLAKRPNVKGGFTWGTQNKLAVHMASDIPIDFFATTAERWYESLVIRTGGKETNLRLTTGAQRLGRKLHAYGNITMEDGRTVRAESERHVFELCGVFYQDPTERR